MRSGFPAAILATLAAVLGGGTAAAASSPGAQVFHTEGCVEEWYATICFQVHDVFNAAHAGESGLVSFTQSAKTAATVTYPDGSVLTGCQVDEANQSNSHYLVSQDGLEQVHFASSNDSVVRCGDFSRTCSVTQTYTVVDGILRAERFEAQCDEPTA